MQIYQRTQMDTWQVEFGCFARDDVFNILYKARLAKSSEEVERDTLWSLRKRKGWIVGNKHGTNGSAAWNISNPFHLIFLTLTCQQWSCKKSENASWGLPISHGTSFPSFPPKKHRKSCQTAFPSVVFLLFFFRFHQLVLAGSCRLHWSTTRLKQWDCASASTLAFGWTLWTSVSSGQSSRGMWSLWRCLEFTQIYI